MMPLVYTASDFSAECQVIAQLTVRDQNKNLDLVTIPVLQFKIYSLQESYYKMEERGSFQAGPDIWF